MGREIPVESVLNWCDGEILQQIDRDTRRVADNLLDARTDPDAVRKVTLTITFKTDEDRRQVRVSAVSKATLAPTRPNSTVLAFAADENGEVQMVEIGGELLGQMAFEEERP